jgi:chemotaxis signal transduction protein
LFALDTSGQDAAEMVMIVEKDGITVAILVDQVMDFMQLEEIKIQIPSRKIPAAIAKYISGYYDQENFGIIYLIDLIKLFQSLTIA